MHFEAFIILQWNWLPINNKLSFSLSRRLIRIAILYQRWDSRQEQHQNLSFPISSSTLFGQVNNELIYFSDRKFYKSNVATDDVTLFKDISNDVSGLGYR